MTRRLFLKVVLIISLSINLIAGMVYGDIIYEKVIKTWTEIITDNNDTRKQHHSIKYFDASDFKISGKFHKEIGYFRLPQKYKKSVRSKVWSLSRYSSGVQVKFATNSPFISVKWRLLNNASPKNMTKIGASGIDLYCLQDSNWQFVNSGIPSGKSNEAMLITDMDSTLKDFVINLPLYDGVESLEIGIDESSLIRNTTFDEKSKPIVFYGTSITQGASASRPGMAYPSIISRSLNIDVINLGFSGNGRFEAELGEVICEIDAQLYVIDCTPNSSPEIIKSNALNLIKAIHQCKPGTPILLMESIVREYAYFKKTHKLVFGGWDYINSQNEALKSIFNEAKEKGIQNLYYLGSEGLIGDDHEGTIDGTHLTDLGMKRIAEKVELKIRDIMTKSSD